MITSVMKQHLSSQTLHPTYHYIVFESQLLQQPFWIHIRSIPSLVQCTNSGHSPFLVFLCTLPQVSHGRLVRRKLKGTTAFGDYILPNHPQLMPKLHKKHHVLQPMYCQVLFKNPSLIVVGPLFNGFESSPPHSMRVPKKMMKLRVRLYVECILINGRLPYNQYILSNADAWLTQNSAQFLFIFSMDPTNCLKICLQQFH